MGYSNLPPGVSVSDIPGNRWIDGAWEAFWNVEHFEMLLYVWADEQEDEELLDKIEQFDEDEAREYCEQHESELPVEKWFDNWLEAGRSDYYG